MRWRKRRRKAEREAKKSVLSEEREQALVKVIQGYQALADKIIHPLSYGHVRTLLHHNQGPGWVVELWHRLGLKLSARALSKLEARGVQIEKKRERCRMPEAKKNRWERKVANSTHQGRGFTTKAGVVG